MNRWDIINFFIEKYGYKTYLEIGYYKGWSFDRVSCDFKTAVDPNPSKTEEQEAWITGQKYNLGKRGVVGEFDTEVLIQVSHDICKMTSDQFFRNLDDSTLISKEEYKFDIIFIDGLHERRQVLRDMRNAFNHLNRNGIVIMHDCNPTYQEHTINGIDGNWTGDVYKAMLDIRNSPQCDAYVIDTDWGVGVVRPVHELKLKDITDIEHVNAISDWEYFNHARKQLLGLIDVSTFVAKERYNIAVNAI